MTPSAYETIELIRDGDIARIVLRGRRGDATLGVTAFIELAGALHTLASDSSRRTRAVLLEPVDGDFVAGRDTAGDAQDALALSMDIHQMFAGTRDMQDALTAEHLNFIIARSLGAVARSPIPVFAAIDGQCVLAGSRLAAACTARFATPRAQFTFGDIDERILALIPVREVSEYTTQPMSADVALERGIVDHLIDPDALTHDALRLVRAHLDALELTPQQAWGELRAMAEARRIELARALQALSCIEHDQRHAAYLYLCQSLDLIDPEWRRTRTPLVREAIDFFGGAPSEETPTPDAFQQVLEDQLTMRTSTAATIDDLAPFTPVYPIVCAWARHVLLEILELEETREDYPMASSARRIYEETLELWGDVVADEEPPVALTRRLETLREFTDEEGDPVLHQHVWSLMVEVVRLGDPLSCATVLHEALLGRGRHVLAQDIFVRPIQERFQSLSEGFEDIAGGGLFSIAGFITRQVVQTGTDLLSIREKLTESFHAHRDRHDEVRRFYDIYDDAFARFALSHLGDHLDALGRFPNVP